MPYGPGTYGSKVGRPPKKYKKGEQGYRDFDTEAPVELDWRKGRAGVGLSPPLDPRGGFERELRDISDPRTTEEYESRAFAPFDKKKKKKKKKKKMNAGGKVRGAGKASQGVRPAKMVKMKGS
jgi:hypothetical protein